MEDTILPDLDDTSLPDLPDSVWMRLLANALDPDTPDVGLDLIPVDLPPDAGVDEDFAWDDDATSDTDSDETTPFDSTDDLADHSGGEQFADHGWQSDSEATGWHETEQDPYSDQI
jgi:hypothetical protein